MDLLTESFKGLYPDKEPTHDMKIIYSGKFSDYNANVYYTVNKMEFRLSKKWRGVSRDIKIGLIQALMQKVLRTKKSSMNIDMYNIFLKKVHVSVPVTKSNPILAKVFEELNQEYFDGLIEPCNLRWGMHAKSRFGSYSYGSDTITINPRLESQPHLLKYVTYHEMLHKKFKFRTKGKKSYHHTKEFKIAEKRYPEAKQLEKELGNLSRRQKISKNVNRFVKNHRSETSGMNLSSN